MSTRPNDNENRAADLTAMALGQTELPESRHLQQLLGADAQARHEFDQTEKLAALVRSAADEDLPERSAALRDAICIRLERAASGVEKTAPARSHRSVWSSSAFWALASSAAGLLILIGSLIYPTIDSKRLSRHDHMDFVGDGWTQLDERTSERQLAPPAPPVEPLPERVDPVGTVEVRITPDYAPQPAEESIAPTVGRDGSLQDRAGQVVERASSDSPDGTIARPPAEGTLMTIVPGSRDDVLAIDPGRLQLAQNPTPQGQLLGGLLSRPDSGGGTFGGGGFSGDSFGRPAAGGGVRAQLGEYSEHYEGHRQPDGPITIPDPHEWAKQRQIRRAGNWGTEQYEALPENDFVPVTPHTALSTFSVDVDTASYSNLRRFITGGQLPPPSSVRIEEWINYFSYDYPPPDDEVPFSVNMEVADCPWAEGHKLMRIGLRGKDVHRDQRPATNLVFLLDVSGSMKDADKLPLLQQALIMMLDQLGEDDRISIVTYAGDAGVRLMPTSGEQNRVIRDAIEGLSAGGSTNGSAGIQLAYDLAGRNFLAEGVNRVILATDGDLNVGITQDDQLVQLIRQQAQSNVFLSVLGFGAGNLKDAKLEKLADNGNGHYAYVDNMREAHKVLVQQMTGSLVAIAKDVKVQLEFNPARVAAYRLIGYENRMLAAEDFRNDAVDAGEIGAGHTVTALYEVIPAKGAAADTSDRVVPKLKYQQPAADVAPARSELTAAAFTGELVTLSLSYKLPDGQSSTQVDYTVRDDHTRFEDASADFRFASAVAACGMILRGSPHRGDGNLALVEQIAASAIGDDSSGYRSEFVDLVRQAASLAR